MEIDEHAVTFLDVHIYVCDTCDYVLCVTVWQQYKCATDSSLGYWNIVDNVDILQFFRKILLKVKHFHCYSIKNRQVSGLEFSNTCAQTKMAGQWRRTLASKIQFRSSPFYQHINTVITLCCYMAESDHSLKGMLSQHWSSAWGCMWDGVSGPSPEKHYHSFDLIASNLAGWQSHPPFLWSLWAEISLGNATMTNENVTVISLIMAICKFFHPFYTQKSNRSCCLWPKYIAEYEGIHSVSF